MGTLGQKVCGMLEEQGMLRKNNNVIVALSGGADSMALFHFMASNRHILGIGRLYAAHFEHGLRGQASLADAAHVASVCRAARVPLLLGHGRMGGRKPPRGMSVEEWARKLRYAFLEEQAMRLKAMVATAHNRDDNAETVLFHAIRGAGPRGLGGIPPVRGCFVRPLLTVSRAEVEAYCADHCLPFVTDASNQNAKYARNRLRLEALPALERAHPGAAANLARLAADMRVLDSWLEEQAKALLLTAEETAHQKTRWGPGGAGRLLDTENLQNAPQPVLLKALALLAGPSADRKALAAMEAVVRGNVRAYELKNSPRRLPSKDALLFVPPAAPGGEEYCVSLSPGSHALPGGFRLQIEIVKAGGPCPAEPEKTDKKDLTFTADYDKISKNSVLRTRRSGDTFTFPARGVTKTLKKWMNEEGLPPSLRDTMPVLADGSRVLWMWKEGFCAGLAPSGETRQILRIHTSMMEE